MEPLSPTPKDFQQALDVLRGGGIIAFPTETYYGLGVDITNEQAIRALFQLKKRPFSKPILLLLHDQAVLKRYVAQVPVPYQRLMDEHWPGSLTLLFPATFCLSPLLTAQTGTIGLRLSPHPVARKLCRCWAQPVTATSANLVGQPPAQTPEEVREIFGDRVDFILDGGRTPGGKCSTVVGMDGQRLLLLRQGKVVLS